MVDLHVHSTASDGTWTPQEVIAQATRAGLEVLALTDHDTIDGFLIARDAARDQGIRLIPAVEFNTDVTDKEIDILGYFWDMPRDEDLTRILHHRQQDRIRRAREMVQRLNDLGIMVTYDRVRAIAQGVVARPHVAQAMIEQGYVQSQKEAYERYLNLGAPAYVYRDPLHPAEAISWIRRAGGIPVVAHPGLIGDDGVLDALVQAGLMGLEAYYPEHSAEESARYVGFAAQHGLLTTAGSDCHGPGRKKYYPLGSVFLPDVAWEAFSSSLRAAWIARYGVA